MQCAVGGGLSIHHSTGAALLILPTVLYFTAICILALPCKVLRCTALHKIVIHCHVYPITTHCTGHYNYTLNFTSGRHLPYGREVPTAESLHVVETRLPQLNRGYYLKRFRHIGVAHFIQVKLEVKDQIENQSNPYTAL